MGKYGKDYSEECRARKEPVPEALVTVKCVCCGRRAVIALSVEEPHCEQCYGPVVVQRIHIVRE